MALGRTRRAAVIFVLLAGLNRAVSMLILPFVSRIFSPAEYGAATMVSATSFLLVSLLALPLDTLVVFAAPRQGDEPRALLRVAALYCYVVLPIFAVIPAAGFALFVPELLGISGAIWAIEIVAVGLMPAMIVYALPMVKSSQDLRKFVWLASTSIVILTISKVLLVIIWRHGVLGWVLSDLVTSALTAIVAMGVVRVPSARVTREDIRKVALFALPLIPHTASHWAISSLSRPALALVSTLQQVGFLSVGLTVASSVNIVLGEVNRAVQPRFSRETFPAPTAKTFVPVRWQIVLAMAVPAAAGCVLASVGRWIFAEPFWPAFTLTGVLLIGQALVGIYPIFINYLVLTAGVTKYSSFATGTGAVVVGICILVFGPRYGAMGVAYGVAAGNLAMAIVALILVRVAKLDVVWTAWRECWPESLAAATALALSTASLAQPVNSAASLILAAWSACLLVVSFLVLGLRSAVTAGVSTNREQS